MKGGKVFISHAAADRQLADAFVRFLRPGAIFAVARSFARRWKGRTLRGARTSLGRSGVS